jgi:16S rRNA (uracil1498-N3)-methyltransferase
MPRLYIPHIPQEINTDLIELKGEDAHYLSDVLRMRPGDEIILFDAEGRRAKAALVNIERLSVEVRVKELLQQTQETEHGIVLAVGTLKATKMDLVVQKATELGIKEIYPLVTERTLVRQTRKLDRWNKIALEASRQCGRSVVPKVHSLKPLDKFIDGWNSPGVVFWEEARKGTLQKSDCQPKGDVAMLVGPEGGFSSNEVAMAVAGGFIVRTLGVNILRAETAAISALAIMQYLRELN